MRLELVRDWMSRELITVGQDTPVAEAEVLMVEHSIRRMPVLENKGLIGIVPLDEVRATPKETTAALAVMEVMSTDPITVNENDTIGRAAQLMLHNKVSGIPVTSANGDLVGIITESDIFRLVVHDWMLSAGDESEPYARYGG